MANDFYRAIEALNAKKKELQDSHDQKLRELEREFQIQDTQLNNAINLLCEIGNVCPECGGSGRVHEYIDMYDDRGSIVTCKKCNGTGTYIHEVRDV